jgi:hypothetical protein
MIVLHLTAALIALAIFFSMALISLADGERRRKRKAIL